MTPSTKNSTDADRRVARVVFLRRDINEPFSYRVEPDRDLRGYPVVVPLGSQLTVGLVIDQTREKPDLDHELKPVRDVITSVQPLPDDLLSLGRWMADYYATPVNRVFEAIMPPRYLPEPRMAWNVISRPDRSPDVPDGLIDLLEPERTITVPKLRERTEASASEVRDWMDDLAERGVVEATLVLSDPEVSRRELNYVELEAKPGTVESFLEDASKRQRELLQYLREHGGTFQRDLPRVLRRTDLLRRLEEAGLINRTRRVHRREPFPGSTEPSSAEPPELTPEQESVVQGILQSDTGRTFESHLIHGVTGSGKTEVYFRLVEQVMERGRSALVLVPEITLATFLMERFRARFGDRLAILHSGLSTGERRDEWRRIQQGEARVVLGVQSAVFAPLPDPGIIVVDEEHDTSYKSGQSPRYHARDVAVMRSKINDVPVVLGSATPSLESYSNAVTDRYRLHIMKDRPLGGELPRVQILDLRGEDGLLTPDLIDRTRECFDREHKAIWFLNRRGFANFLLCESCGEALNCGRCDVSMTIHRGPDQLRCHYCGMTRGVPDRCPECDSDEVHQLGMGTQQLSNRADELFDGVTIVRMDADTTTRKASRYEHLQRFAEPGPKLLVGTQMVTKGLDFPDVDFVGVVLVDTGLRFPDFRAGERTFQQLVQVCGRAGRKRAGARVLVQTYNPDHYAVQLGAKADYEGFFRREASTRKPLRYPPFARLINVMALGREEERVSRSLQDLRRQLPEQDDVEILGPAPCGIRYMEERHRWHLLARGRFSADWRRTLRRAVDEGSRDVRLVVDVDPVDVQ